MAKQRLTRLSKKANVGLFTAKRLLKTCGSVSNTEELTCPCVQAGFQSGDTSVEFHFVCSQALLFRFRCDDLCTQFPQAPQVTVEPLLSISLLAATVRSGEPYHEHR
jgi:hypothetical protein